MRAFYHAGLGRFLARDRMRKGGMNKYVAYKNNPLSWVDPAGAQDVPAWITKEQVKKWKDLSAAEREELGGLAGSLERSVAYMEIKNYLAGKEIPCIKLADLQKVKDFLQTVTYKWDPNPNASTTATTKGTTTTLHKEPSASTLFHEAWQLAAEQQGIGYERGQGIVYYMDDVIATAIQRLSNIQKMLANAACDPETVKKRWKDLENEMLSMRTQKVEIAGVFGGRKRVTYTVTDADINLLKDKFGLSVNLQDIWDCMKDMCCGTGAGKKNLGNIVPRP